ncbi:GntR family transcriptional regulator [Arthrobacter sp. NyZ413]|uniref:GntR family transcriptional regulator n=1 Tax=Arthrobacter sp. NyZ413 TaxID=3144669 RepID=UPI002C62F011|nr:GntR family transcriptional regulator [Arthrobacter sp.]
MSAEVLDENSVGSPSRATSVYEWIRERIIDGTLPPGERIREREVAEKLQVSRVPVREALPQLESEGYITTTPRRGAVVTHVTLRAATELFDVRSSLEVLAARLAAEACSKGASADRLREVLSEALQATEADEAVHIADVNSRLHEEILALSGNSLLQKLMTPVNGHVRRLFHIAADRDQHELHREHIAIVEAILRGQGDLAAALSYAHVEQSRNECLAIIGGS